MNAQPSVPRQRKGASSDVYYTVRVKNEQSAQDIFRNARLNLLNVNGWHSLVGSGAEFRLFDENGEEVNSVVQKGNYFRIGIPGVPATAEGNGSEWVVVEEVEEGQGPVQEFVYIQVRPSPAPVNNEKAVAHFFSDDATSTFSVIRNKNRVTVSVLGRNEKPNTKTGNWLSLIRNFFVAIGAMLGFNRPQWRKLAKAIAKTKGGVMRVVE